MNLDALNDVDDADAPDFERLGVNGSPPDSLRFRADAVVSCFCTPVARLAVLEPVSFSEDDDDDACDDGEPDDIVISD